VRTSFCRICFNGCPILVELDGAGLAVSVTGDHLSDSPHAGFTCNKGRAQPAFLWHADRLLHSLKRQPDGSFERIPIGQAVEEIAECLTTIKAKHGSRAIASYWGTMAVRSALTTPILEAFMTGVGSPMRFNPNTIDKPGKGIARALHGSWQAPAQGFDRPDVAVLVGINPLVSFQGNG
jgi:anaerobic selenocysteine-containing dehydrogenase